MSRTLSILAASALGFSTLAFVPMAQAHGPSRQKVTETIEINAPPAKVWNIIKNFHDMDWDPEVASTTGTGGNTLQSFRTLHLKNGGTLHDDLERYSAEDHSYATFLPHNDPKILPVTDFSTEIEIDPANGGKSSTVEWRGAFYRGDPNNNPPPNMSDAAAIKAVSAFLKTGLEGLKKKAESGS